MRYLSNLTLAALQWLLVLWGIFTLLVTLNTFYFEYQSFSAVPEVAFSGDWYRPPLYHRLVVGIATGLCAIGLGGVMFYLRRLYLNRTSSDAV
ncbi:MAG: hypothetical protein AAFQ79_11640 [Pseudomonadota bacterium]